MKLLLTKIFSLLIFFCFGQTKKNNDALYDLSIAYKPATITIMTDTNLLASTVVNNIQKITYTDIKPGHYKIQISGQGQQTVIRDSVIVANGQRLILNFRIDGPCLYDHPANYIPTCPKDHVDRIIQIIYGLAVTRSDTFTKDKKDMKIKYAGCVLTGCDPKFYCKEHHMEF